MNTIHELINELGARLNEEERYEATIIFNNLYLNGFSDLWICIALYRIIQKGSFNQWKYLLSFDDFLEENDYLENEYMKLSLEDKIKDLDLALGYNKDLKITNEEVDYIYDYFIYPNSINDIEEERKEEFDYYYLKYQFLDSIQYVLKYLFRRTN